MKMVYLLWSGGSQEKYLEDIFEWKIDAEKAMREFKDTDKQSGASYHYWIQEREVHLGGTK
jgi:hypothetical protein